MKLRSKYLLVDAELNINQYQSVGQHNIDYDDFRLQRSKQLIYDLKCILEFITECTGVPFKAINLFIPEVHEDRHSSISIGNTLTLICTKFQFN